MSAASNHRRRAEINGRTNPLERPFSAADCGTLIEGLESLLRERLMAYRLATRLMAEPGEAAIDAGRFGLTDIIRLKQILESYVDRPRDIAGD